MKKSIIENNLEWVKDLKIDDSLYVKRTRNETEIQYILSKVVKVSKDEVELDTGFLIKIDSKDIDIIATINIAEITDLFIFNGDEEGTKSKKLDELDTKYPDLKLNVFVSMPLVFAFLLLTSTIFKEPFGLKAIGELFLQTILLSFSFGYLYYFIKKLIVNIKYNKILKK